MTRSRPSDSAVIVPGTQAALEDWLERQGGVPASLQQLVGDVSQRHYLRLELAAGGTAVLAVYPQSLADVFGRFCNTTRWLEELGVRVPAILAAEPEAGWMLVEDLGPRTLHQLPSLAWDELQLYYQAAIEASGRIATLPAEQVASSSPALDEALLAKELRQTHESFLVPRGLLADEGLRGTVEAALAELCRDLGATATVACHRDLMVRNLVPVAPPSAQLKALGVLDHQDLRLGPPFYDVASLLNDSFFPPEEWEERLLARVLTDAEDREAYHRVAVQRTLKAVGTYATFALRGSDRHVPLIAPTLGRALHHWARLPQYADLARELRSRWASELA